MEGVFPFGAGHGACANPIFDLQKLWVQAGPALEPYCVYLDPCSAALAPYLGYFRVFVALILDLDISWLLRFGFVGLVFGVGHFKVVGSWPCSSSLWTWGISVSLSFGSLHSVAKENSIYTQRIAILCWLRC